MNERQPDFIGSLTGLASPPLRGPASLGTVTRLRVVKPDAATARSPLPDAGAPYFVTCVSAWLAQVGRMIEGLSACCVVHVPNDGLEEQIASWHTVAASAAADPDDLAFAGRAAREKTFLVDRLGDDASLRRIAMPLVKAHLPHHVVVVRLQRAPEARVVAECSALLQGSAWLKYLLEIQTGGAAGGPSMPADGSPREVLDLLAATLQGENLQAAAAALANGFAALTGASRVSLGLLEGRRLRIICVSGSASHERTSALSSALRGAMEEALRQGAILCAPEDPDAPLREEAAQQLLLREARCSAVASVPFAAGDAMIGACTLEWADAAAATAVHRERCRAVLALAGPVLWALQRAEASSGRRLRDDLMGGVRRLVGPSHPLVKLGTLAGLLLLAAAATLTDTYRVTGEAVLRGSVQRVVLAPVDGYIATAVARPGDVVESGAVLATLDDEALQLEAAKWLAEYDRLETEYRDAMAQLDAARVAVLRAGIDRAAAEYELAETNLEHSRILAPLAGVVVSGDFSQQIGAPVQRGATLFELAPLESYRIDIRVPEDEIGAIEAGQKGRLVLRSLPGTGLDIAVERVLPVSEVIDGHNVFEVEARLIDATPAALRPGMQGVAKLEAGRATLLWLWTHRAYDWLRIQVWSLGLWDSGA